MISIYGFICKLKNLSLIKDYKGKEAKVLDLSENGGIKFERRLLLSFLL